MKKVSITKIELQFLYEFLSEKLPMRNFEVSFSDQEKDAISDSLGILLQKIGFDKGYNLTEKGRIIEDLIDKLND